ncbi:MAG TPA: hypothetical protein VI306_16505 [Pyrinomonadaceae bacterium]
MRKLMIAGAVSLLLGSLLAGSSMASPQQTDFTGRYIFKDYRKGKGGYENHLEITGGPNGGLHVSFELTYLYMVGGSETFHDGSGEGDGQLKGNVLTATLSAGADGSCRVTMTFSETMVAGEYNVTVKSSRCQINVMPDGVYRKVAEKSAAINRIAAPRPLVPRTVLPQEVCPDPKSPCSIKAKTFAPYEISFQLPGKLIRGRTYTSLPFYAVLIKTYEEESCDADDHTESIERERQKIQLAYPHNKVFAAYSCPNLDAIDYAFPGKMDSSGNQVLIQTFIAVYAGKTEADAKQFLDYVKTVYPAAVLKKMTASYEVMDQ